MAPAQPRDHSRERFTIIVKLLVYFSEGNTKEAVASYQVRIPHGLRQMAWPFFDSPERSLDAAPSVNKTWSQESARLL